MSAPKLAPQAEYLDVAETAKLIRKALKKRWPGQKFSVRSDRYAGGSSINVHYVGGPASRDVESVVNAYQGGGFDGMIDMAYSQYSWLAPDGSASRAHNPGTQGSMGSHAESFGDPHAPGCRLVRFGGDHVFVSREHTDQEYWATVAAIERLTGCVVRHDVRSGRVVPLWAISGKAHEPVPDFDDEEAVCAYWHGANGPRLSPLKGVLEHHVSNITAAVFAQVMSPEERAERAKFDA